MYMQKAVARRQARSSEWQVKLHQNASNTRREELRASHAQSKTMYNTLPAHLTLVCVCLTCLWPAENQLVKDVNDAHQCIDELLKQKTKAAQLLDDARAVDLDTIEDLKTDITTITAESVRYLTVQLRVNIMLEHPQNTIGCPPLSAFIVEDARFALHTSNYYTIIAPYL